MEDAPTTMREFEMIFQLRRHLHLYDDTLSPEAAWEEALKEASHLRELRSDMRSVLQKSER